MAFAGIAMTTKHWLILALFIAVFMTACQGRNQSAAEPPSDRAPAPAPAVNNVPDQWLGQWNGPEGTFIVLSKNDDKYVVKIQSLDGPATYEGTAVGDRIEFQRNGKTESIHAGSGQETGMKWLLDKKNCLIVKTGEGFCRE